MIQRKQSLYWLLAAILAVVTIFLPFMQLVVSDGDYLFSASGIFKGAEKIISAMPITVYLILLALINLGVIFLYKKRVLQARISTFLCFLSIGFYCLLVFYRYMSFTGEVLNTQYSVGIIFPLIGGILDYMATRAVIKDENKIKSLDRIR